MNHDVNQSRPAAEQFSVSSRISWSCRIACAAIALLMPHPVWAEIEFFFNTSPSDPPKLITRIAQSFPVSSVGHGTMYISKACRDEGTEGNRIRPCTDSDPEHGLVISFDVDLQKVTGYYFLAVSRNEFFYGNLDPEDLPDRITRRVIDEMDAYFYDKMPLLRSEEYFRRRVEKLSRDTGQPYEALSRLLVELSHAGFTGRNLDRLMREHGLIPNDRRQQQEVRAKIKTVAAHFEKNGISPEGMSRRVVTWAVRLYQGVWGLVYPTTEQEELELIDYINSLSKEEADILGVNCVMPLDVVRRTLVTQEKASSDGFDDSPRHIHIPYFVMKRLVKGAFEAGVADVNEFGEFIRRPGAHMKFYPQVAISFDKDVPRAPKTIFDKGELVDFYVRYQSKYANYIDWIIETLLADGVAADSDTIHSLREIRERVYEEEARINQLERDYESTARHDPALAELIERDRQALLERFDDEILEVMGANPDIEPPGGGTGNL